MIALRFMVHPLLFPTSLERWEWGLLTPLGVRSGSTHLAARQSQTRLFIGRFPSLFDLMVKIIRLEGQRRLRCWHRFAAVLPAL